MVRLMLGSQNELINFKQAAFGVCCYLCRLYALYPYTLYIPIIYNFNIYNLFLKLIMTVSHLIRYHPVQTPIYQTSNLDLNGLAN